MKLVAWMRDDGTKCMPADEKEAWIEAGKGDLVADYTQPLYSAEAHLMTDALMQEAMRWAAGEVDAEYFRAYVDEVLSTYSELNLIS
jgi:hypothetical protein